MDLFTSPNACRCPSCSQSPLPTYTEKFRMECEIRSVVALPSNEGRRAYLELVEKRRGVNAAEHIRQAVWKALKEIL